MARGVALGQKLLRYAVHGLEPVAGRIAGQRAALLWANHVHDALAFVGHAEIGYAEITGIFFQSLNL